MFRYGMEFSSWYGLSLRSVVMWYGALVCVMTLSDKVRFFSIPEIPGVLYPWYHRPQIDDWKKLKQFVYQRDEGCCRYCFHPVEYIESHCHHVLPLSEGGTNHPRNLKTACIPCHEDKHPFMKYGRKRLHNMR